MSDCIFIDAQKHEKVPEYLHALDILVIPYPNLPHSAVRVSDEGLGISRRRKAYCLCQPSCYCRGFARQRASRLYRGTRARSLLQSNGHRPITPTLITPPITHGRLVQRNIVSILTKKV